MPTAPQFREAIREWALASIGFDRLKCRSQDPGREFFVADAGQFTPGFFAAGHGYDFFEDAQADLSDGLGAVEDGAGIDVHVLLHPVVEGSVGGHLDARRRFAAINAAAAGGEDANVATAANEAGHAHRI